jgi:serine/threonine protein kinase
MTDRFETIQLRPSEGGDLDAANGRGEFAAVRVGGAIDGYQVVDNLAEGGMGAVFRVQDRENQSELALKTPLPNGRGGSYHNRLRRFLREARLTARMEHEGVAKVRDQGQCEGLPYFTVELIDGVPLSERLYEEGVLPIVEAVKIVEATARAAHHVHDQGVIHRDLKPANILIREDGAPVIIDFGLARDATGIDPRITESGIWLGTPAYISPEQALGEASRVGPRADVYSLGAVLYELLTGLPPHGVGSPRAIFRALRRQEPKAPSELRRVPETLDAVILKALAREESARYPNAEAFANALAGLIEQFELDPPQDDQADSALECSWDLDGSGDDTDTVTGWNQDTAIRTNDDSALRIHDSAQPQVLEPIPVEDELEDSRSRKARRRSSTKSKTLRSSKTKTVRKSSKTKTRSTRRSTGKARAVRQAARRRREEGMTRYLAFLGPAVALGVGLLLLL